MKKANRSLKNKQTRSSLRVESLEQRQLLAGITGGGDEVLTDLTHANGNVYDQVLMTGSSVTVTADAGQVTRVSFLDLQGDIVQAEFSGAGTLTISLDSFGAAAEAAKYNQPGVLYVSGLASFTIQGADSTTNFGVFSVGTATAHGGAASSLFEGGLTGGNHTADISRLAIVADPSNASGSTFGGIRAGNAIFSADSGTVGIAAANVQVQNVVTIGDIAATGTGTPTLVFGTNSQFSNVTIAGGDLVQANSAAINNTGSYGYKLVLAAGQDSAGTALAAQTVSDSLAFTGTNPTNVGGLSFTLTAGIDTFNGGGAKDTFTATDPAHIGAFDVISGGDGTDTLRIVDLAAGNNLGAFTTANSTVTGIENVEIQGADATAMVVNLSSVTGLNKVTITNTASNTTLTTTANATEVTVAGFATGTVAITDAGSATTDKLATVTVGGNTTGTVTIDSSALTTLNLSNSSGNVTTSPAAGGATARTYNVNGVTGGVITDTATTGVTINSTGSASSGITLTTVAAKTVALNATGANLTLADVNLTAATGITVSGAKNVTISAASDVTALTSIDASAATGGVTITPVLGAGITYTGGAGADSISLGATTKAITTGAGNDSVTFGAAITGTVDAGDGTDSMVMTATQADALDASTTFNGKVSNFERLTVTATGGETLNLTNLDGVSYVASSGTGLTLNNMADAGTLSLTAASTAHTVTMKDATGTTDSFNIAIGGTSNTATAYGTVTVAGVETLTIASDDTAASPAGVQHTLTVVDADAKSITVSGDAGVALTFAGTALTTFDASAVTKGAVAYTTGALTAASTITGGAGADVLNAAASTKAVTLSGNAGNDVLSGSGTVASTLTGGDGNDTLNGGTGADTIDGGAGTDTINSGTGLDILTGGAGNDTFSISVPTNGNTYATITDAAAGDIIDFSDKGTSTLTTAQITLASTAAFQDYLDAAAAGDGSTNGAIKWFVYDGNTYIVNDVSAATTFQNGADTVVRLSGSVDVSKATFVLNTTATIKLG